MTLKELIQRAIDIASQGLDESTVLTSPEEVAEPLLPSVFHAVGLRFASDEHLRSQLLKTKTLVVVDGAVTLPSDVLTSCLHTASLSDAADATKRYSYAPWGQFTNQQLDQRLGYFTLEGEDTLRVVEPNSAYDPAATGPDITLKFTVSCEPAIPAAITDQVVSTNEVLIALINQLAEALKPVMARR